MKNANGFGSVYKMSGRRRRPWRAVVTVGRTYDGHQIRKTLGYFETKKEALSALGLYNAAPYELNKLKFSDIYRMWSEEHFPELSAATIVNYENAYKHSFALYNKPFRELRTQDLEQCIRCAGLTPSIQRDVKLLFLQLYKYALRYDYAIRNYAESVKIDALPETEKRRVFTDDEILRLWAYIDEPHHYTRLSAAKLALIGIYSGWRASELCTYELDGDLMRGGLKTKSGKDRIVPVHPLIAGFADRGGEKITYKILNQRFGGLMKELGWSHTFHDTRRTFATLASRYKMDENIRKLIMGHKIADLTERVYTTHTVEELKKEMAKIGRI